MKNKSSLGEILNIVFIGFIGFITLYPFIYILAVSLTPPAVSIIRKVYLWPYGIDFSTYVSIFNDARIIYGFKNSAIYTVLGTIISVFMTVLMAYPLASASFNKYGKFFMKLIIITMLFSGGLIPTYLLVKNLGFIDTVWAMVIPGAISPFNLILVRTFIQQLPGDINDAAIIDGANEAKIFYRIIIPLCKPIIACITLYYAVGIWNSYFGPLIFINTPKKYPLQVFLREIVIGAQMAEQRQQASQLSGTKEVKFATEAVKTCTLVVSTIPILVMYPFLQKYFVKGIMLGAVKG